MLPTHGVGTEQRPRPPRPGSPSARSSPVPGCSGARHGAEQASTPSELSPPLAGGRARLCRGGPGEVQRFCSPGSKANRLCRKGRKDRAGMRSQRRQPPLGTASAPSQRPAELHPCQHPTSLPSSLYDACGQGKRSPERLNNLPKVSRQVATDADWNPALWGSWPEIVTTQGQTSQTSWERGQHGDHTWEARGSQVPLPSLGVSPPRPPAHQGPGISDAAGNTVRRSFLALTDEASDPHLALREGCLHPVLIGTDSASQSSVTKGNLGGHPSHRVWPVLTPPHGTRTKGCCWQEQRLSPRPV